MNCVQVRRLAVLSTCCLLAACATYPKQSYVELNSAQHPVFEPYSGKPAFARVEDMSAKADDLYGEGYMMLGYSQFVSPLAPALAENSSTLWGQEVGAAYVALETPRPAKGMNHGYLITYWAKRRPDQSSLGAYIQDLPKDLLDQIGEEFNVVIVRQVVKGTPAASAGLQANDVLLALDDVRVVGTRDFLIRLRDYYGKPVVLSVSRKGERHDLTVTPAPLSEAARDRAAAGAADTRPPQFHDEPWLNTQPTDWSSLGDIGAMSAASVQNYQRMELQRQLQYERAQAQFQRNAATLRSGGSLPDYSQASRRGGGAPPEASQRGGGPPPGASLRGGGSPAELSRRGAGPSREEMAREQQKFAESMGRYWENRGKVMQRQKLEIYYDNLPNIYNQVFAFPRPKPL